MKVDISKTGAILNVAVTGKLDTLTAPQLEEQVSREFDGITELVLDFKDLDYISSAGLRVLVSFSHKMEGKGKMVIRNANEDIMDIFEITGFVDIFTIE